MIILLSKDKPEFEMPVTVKDLCIVYEGNVESDLVIEYKRGLSWRELLTKPANELVNLQGNYNELMETLDKARRVRFRLTDPNAKGKLAIMVYNV